MKLQQKNTSVIYTVALYVYCRICEANLTTSHITHSDLVEEGRAALLP